MESLIFLIVFIIIVFLFKTGFTKYQGPQRKGEVAEDKVFSKLINIGVKEEDIFHDLYLEKYNKKYSQIDLVVLTSVGIIVMEVKNYSGWIFGNAFHKEWTQVLNYGKSKYRFYNPVKQNYYHILELKRYLRLPLNIPFYSLIVFHGNCELKSINDVPENTFIIKQDILLLTINSIISSNNQINYPDKIETIELLLKCVENSKNEYIKDRHIKNIKEMLEK